MNGPCARGSAIHAWRGERVERCRFLGRRALTFELRDAFPGVGEALRREIAGLVLVGRLLWGFVRWAWHGADLTIPSNGSSQANFGFDLASIWKICVVFFLCQRLLLCRQLDQRMMMGSQMTSAAVEGVFGCVWRALHAAGLADVGGALGCWAGAKVSTMINRPPQHGQGSARILGV